MSAVDPWSLVASRFDGVDNRLSAQDARTAKVEDEVDGFKEVVAVLRQEVTQMTDSFKALRTALYACAAVIVAAAVLLVVLGKHP